MVPTTPLEVLTGITSRLFLLLISPPDETGAVASGWYSIETALFPPCRPSSMHHGTHQFQFIVIQPPSVAFAAEARRDPSGERDHDAGSDEIVRHDP